MKRVALILMLIVGTIARTSAQDNPCGLSPSDWCVDPKDPCSRHRTINACKADDRCYGMPYRGESLVACVDDGQGRGFAANCPTVGCTSTPPQRQK